MPITPIYAAILGLIYFALSIRVIKFRRSNKVALGYAHKKDFRRAIRVHANFAEYVPMSLLLLWFLESLTYAALLIHILGVMLIIGRLIHAYGLSQVQEDTRFRVYGMLLTFAVLVGCCIRILLHYLPV